MIPHVISQKQENDSSLQPIDADINVHRQYVDATCTGNSLRVY